MWKRTTGCVLALAAWASAEPPKWQPPEEVMQARGQRTPWPIEVVKGDSGAIGVFVFEKDGGLTFRVSPNGRAPWKILLLPLGIPGCPVVDGDRVRVLVGDFENREVSLAAFDLEKCEETSRVKIPGKAPSTPMFSALHVRGEEMYASVGCERGETLFARSADGGKTWSELVAIAGNSVRDDAVAAPLFLTASGLVLFNVGADGTLASRASRDGGETWKDAAPPALRFPDDAGAPRLMVGASSGKSLHLAVQTATARIYHFVSRDDGLTFGAATLLAVNRPSDLADIFQLRARGSVVILSWSEPGTSDRHTKKARCLVSRDAGGSWAESAVAEGLAGDSGFPAVWIEEDGRLVAALAAVPGEKEPGNRYVLVRSCGPGSGAWPGDRQVPEWWRSTK